MRFTYISSKYVQPLCAFLLLHVILQMRCTTMRIYILEGDLMLSSVAARRAPNNRRGFDIARAPAGIGRRHVDTARSSRLVVVAPGDCPWTASHRYRRSVAAAARLRLLGMRLRCRLALACRFPLAHTAGSRPINIGDITRHWPPSLVFKTHVTALKFRTLPTRVQNSLIGLCRIVTTLVVDSTLSA